MPVEWTKAQRAAIETRNKSLVVSAAAGSGKTSVMCERIIRKIVRENGEISRLLITTFTKDATNQLRRKIYEALTKAFENEPQNKRIRRQMLYLPTAKITTIDSFFADVVRNNAAKINIASDFRYIDETENMLLQKKIMNDIIENSFANDKEFGAFLSVYANVHSIEYLPEKFIDIYQNLYTTADFLSFFDIVV